MPCSDAKLAILADRYGFDLDDAREYVGLPPVNKRFPAKVGVSGSYPVNPTTDKKVRCCSLCGIAGHNKLSCPNGKSTPDKIVKNDKGAKSKNIPAGYDLYVKANKNKLIAEVKSKLGHGDKLPNQKIITMLTYDWNALSEHGRKSWNHRAMAMA